MKTKYMTEQEIFKWHMSAYKEFMRRNMKIKNINLDNIKGVI